MMRQELRELHSQAGTPKTSSLKEHADRRGHSVGRSTLAAVLTGNGGLRWATVEAFVDACTSYADSRHRPLPSDATDLTHWRALYDAAYPNTRAAKDTTTAFRAAHLHGRGGVLDQQRAKTYVRLLKWIKEAQDGVHRVNGILSFIKAMTLPPKLDARVTAFASDQVQQAVRDFGNAWLKAYKTVQREDERLREILAVTDGGLAAKLAAMLEAVPEYEAAAQATEKLRTAIRRELS